MSLGLSVSANCCVLSVCALRLAGNPFRVFTNVFSCNRRNYRGLKTRLNTKWDPPTHRREKTSARLPLILRMPISTIVRHFLFCFYTCRNMYSSVPWDCCTKLEKKIGHWLTSSRKLRVNQQRLWWSQTSSAVHFFPQSLQDTANQHSSSTQKTEFITSNGLIRTSPSLLER